MVDLTEFELGCDSFCRVFTWCPSQNDERIDLQTLYKALLCVYCDAIE